jgi:hypothetical protein
MDKFAKCVDFPTPIEIDTFFSKKAQSMQVQNSKYLRNQSLGGSTNSIQLESRCTKAEWMQNNVGLWLNLKFIVGKPRDRIRRFPKKHVDFDFSRKIYTFGELIHMLGRILGWFRYQNTCTSSAYAKVAWALNISELAHLKFVAFVFFWGCRQGSLTCPDHMGA